MAKAPKSLTAATAEQQEWTVGGETVMIDVIDVRIIRQVEAWYKQHLIEEAIKTIEGLPLELQARVLADARKEAREFHILSPDGLAYLRSFDGMVRGYFYATRKTAKHLTIEDIERRVYNDRIEAAEKHAAAAGTSSDSEDPTNPPAQNPPPAE